MPACSSRSPRSVPSDSPSSAPYTITLTLIFHASPRLVCPSSSSIACEKRKVANDEFIHSYLSSVLFYLLPWFNWSKLCFALPHSRLAVFIHPYDFFLLPSPRFCCSLLRDQIHNSTGSPLFLCPMLRSNLCGDPALSLLAEPLKISPRVIRHVIVFTSALVVCQRDGQPLFTDRSSFLLALLLCFSDSSIRPHRPVSLPILFVLLWSPFSKTQRTLSSSYHLSPVPLFIRPGRRPGRLVFTSSTCFSFPCPSLSTLTGYVSLPVSLLLFVSRRNYAYYLCLTPS